MSAQCPECHAIVALLTGNRLAVHMARAFTCPRCGRVSHHPVDAIEGYCGSCADFTGEPGTLCGGTGWKLGTVDSGTRATWLRRLRAVRLTRGGPR